MPESPLAIANYFIKLAHDTGGVVDAMKLQKLVYFAHGWHLAITGKPLLNERVEAWKYGPVVPSLYQDFKRQGRDAIDFPGFRFVDGRRAAPPMVSADQTRKLLDRVWEVYGHYDSVKLANMSHAQNGPWHRVWEDETMKGEIHGVDISDIVIQRYFQELVRQRSVSQQKG